MTEAEIQAEILLAIGRIPGAIFWRNNSGSLPTRNGRVVRFGLVGSPDIIGCVRGRFVGIEVKAVSRRQSDQQRNFQAAFEKSGGTYVLAHSAEDALSAIRSIP